MCLDNSVVAIRLQHLPSGVFSPGIPNGTGDASISAFTLLNMTFERACTHKKKKNRCVHAHTQAHSHTSQRLCESQNAEPEGCCVSDVCIVYSVVPVHVGDCCALRPHSSLVLFTMTGVDSRLQSRRAERPSKERGGRSKETERDHRLYLFLLYLFTYCFSLLFGFVFDPFSSNLCPHGSPAVRQPEEGAASLLILSSLTFCRLGYAPFCTRGIIREPQVSEPKPHRC